MDPKCTSTVGNTNVNSFSHIKYKKISYFVHAIMMKRHTYAHAPASSYIHDAIIRKAGRQKENNNRVVYVTGASTPPPPQPQALPLPLKRKNSPPPSSACEADATTTEGAASSLHTRRRVAAETPDKARSAVRERGSPAPVRHTPC